MIRAALAAILISILLSACGGGGGGGGDNSQPAQQQPPVARSTPLRVGYFGVDGDQIRETADHASYVFVMDWCDWNSLAQCNDYTIAKLQEAKARGIKEAWVAIGYLVFTQQRGGCTLDRYVVRPDAIPRVKAFRQQLQALGLDEMVTVLYPVDEPELHCLDNDTLTRLVSSIKMEWSAYLGVIYGDTNNYPGLAVYDLVGKDHYPGTRVLSELPPINDSQRHLLVPGGSDPWRDDPAEFFQYAQQHGDVYAIVSFVFFDRTDESGRQQRGIRSNGMAPRYRQMACDAEEKC